MKFIAEQEDHRCPHCRVEFEGTPADIINTFFEVYEEDEQLYDQAKGMIVGYLTQY